MSATATSLRYPDDYVACTVGGVRLTRSTKLHEPGVYDAVAPSGRAYVIIGVDSKRLPWRVTYQGSRVAVFPTIETAARGIAADDAARGGAR